MQTFEIERSQAGLFFVTSKEPPGLLGVGASIGAALMDAGQACGELDAARQPYTASRNVAQEIFTERLRQIETEGWSLDHDDRKRPDELPRAAATYAYAAGLVPDEVMTHDAALYREPRGFVSVVRTLWPWEPGWFKPAHASRRMLIIAGALIVAAVEKLDRAEARRRDR